MQCGLLGRKLGHSYSPQIHQSLGEYRYDLFEVEPQDLAHFLKTVPFQGLNVTIPYKKDVMSHCTDLSDAAKAIGSVNTLVRRPDGSLYGDNTDWVGFTAMIQASALEPKGKKVLILGSGGASVTAQYVMKKLGAGQVVVISRSGPNNYETLCRHKDAQILVNTTPVGMYPETGVSPVDLTLLPNLQGVLDVIYNPARTALLLQAENLGLTAMNGLLMLVAQAKRASELFTGREIDDSVIPTITAQLHSQMENRILVGMPGCGKSTVGKLLAQRLGRKFVDADDEIVKLAGKSIPQIFLESGEEGFRQIESRVLNQLGKQSGLVIATGGGCVTREENYPHLHQNGTIVFLQRALSQLPTDGRPLSQGADLAAMYEKREPMYRRFADVCIQNNRSPEDTAAAIEEVIHENSCTQRS